MNIKVQCSAAVFCMVCVFIVPSVCVQLKRFQTDQRMSGETVRKTAFSLLECSVLFENNEGFSSFSYKKDENMCELSSSYPEGGTIVSEGWKVYAPIVNGGWADWMAWGTCSVTCGEGTRERSRSCTNPSPSNGGTSCPGDSSQTSSCNEQHCGCVCYQYTPGDHSAMSGGVSERQQCESHVGHVFTRGDDNSCPGCGGCWCCTRL